MDIRPEIRISDAEREAMSHRLASAFAEGRLDPEELEARLEVALQATTASELAEVAADLPRPRPRPAAPARFRVRRPLGLLDLQVFLVAPVIALTLLVAINSGTYIWPAWVWFLCAAPIVAWLLVPRYRTH